MMTKKTKKKHHDFRSYDMQEQVKFDMFYRISDEVFVCMHSGIF